MNHDHENKWAAIGKKLVPAACLLSIAAVLVVAVVTVQYEKPGVQATPVEQDNDSAYRKLVAEGNQAFQQHNWAKAIAVHEQIVRENPDEAMAWFRLGYCLHFKGRHDAALAAYKNALHMPRLKPVTYYNMSCAYALKKMKNESMLYLRKSIDAGFRSPRPITEDPDFSEYLSDSEFQKLARIAKTTSEKVYRQFDFWIGKWDVHNPDGKKLGVNEITKSENGYLLTEKWRSVQSNRSGTSMNYYDPSTHQWKQVWVDADGGIIRYSGTFLNGKMRFNGEYYNRRNERGLSRAMFTPLKDGRVHQLIQRSRDGGKTWTNDFEGYYTRQYSTL